MAGRFDSRFNTHPVPWQEHRPLPVCFQLSHYGLPTRAFCHFTTEAARPFLQHTSGFNCAHKACLLFKTKERVLTVHEWLRWKTCLVCEFCARLAALCADHGTSTPLSSACQSLSQQQASQPTAFICRHTKTSWGRRHRRSNAGRIAVNRFAI